MTTETTQRPILGRFAPSPTGRMHAGNIYAYLMAWLIVKSQGGQMLLRIENLDRERSRSAYADQVMDDLASLGLTWDQGPLYQSDRDEAYRAAFERIREQASVYPCFCTRAMLQGERDASAPHAGEKQIYRGTCRGLSEAEVRHRTEELALEGRTPSYRLQVPHREIAFTDQFQGAFGETLDKDCGDFVLKRADGGFAYQLAVVVDDADRGVSSVVRGFDLLDSTPQQIHLQELLEVPTPTYGHVPLFVAPDGRRLAKRNADAHFDALLERFGSPAAVIGHIAYLGGIIEEDAPVTPEDLLEGFDLEQVKKRLEAQGSLQSIIFR